MASIKASCIWCRVEECNGKVYSEIKDRTQNALMTIFLVEKRNLIDNTSITG
jgi:hypothetical protein